MKSLCICLQLFYIEYMKYSKDCFTIIAIYFIILNILLIHMTIFMWDIYHTPTQVMMSDVVDQLVLQPKYEGLGYL